jgi:hypothetical protein
MIHEFMCKPVPDDWQKWTLDRRRDYWATNAKGNYNLVARDRISVIEVWCEMFNKNKGDIKIPEKNEIRSCISTCPGWKRAPKPFKDGPYGTQRGYVRTVTEDM